MPTLDNVSYSLNVAGTLNNLLDLASKASASLSFARSGSMTSGVGASQADKIWWDTRSIAASGVDDLDLNGTALQDPLGVNLALARIKVLAVYAYPANVNNLLIGAAAANPVSTILGATGVLTVRPGGLLLLTAPDVTAYGVTAATADILRFANSGAGTAVQYDAVVIGASA
jgi:hypothetical protein